MDRGALVLFLLSQLNIFALADGKPTPVFATGVRTAVEGEATRITVFGTAPLAHSVRRVDEHTLVVELPGVDAAKLSPSYLSDSPLVSGMSVRCDRTPAGDALARFLVALRQPARERSYLSGNDLILELTPLAPAATPPQQSAQPSQQDSAAAAAELSPMDQTPRQTPTPAATPNVLITRPGAQTPDASQRGALPANAQGQHYGEYGFVGEPINLNVVNADIRDILNYITEQYGVNFVIDSSVGAVPVTVNVTDVPWNIALDSILRANRLGIEVTGNILRVATLDVLAKEAEAQKAIADAKLEAAPLVTEFIRLNYARGSNNLAQQSGSTGNFAGGSSSGSTSGQSGGAGGGSSAGQQGGGGGDQGILPIIQHRLSRRGSVEVDGRSNTLIVTDVRENIPAIRQLVALLDQPEPQVEIETRIVIASRNFSRDLGVQLSAGVVNLGRGALGNISTLPASSTGSGGGGGGGGALRSGPNPFGVFGGLSGTNQPAPSLGATAANTVIGLTTGLIGTAQISLALTAAEANGQAKIVATPRVTALNNRPAQIESGSQIPVVTPQTSSGSTGNVFTTTFISVPLRLSVTPQITDAGTVVLRVVAENNSVNLSLTNSLGTPGIDTQRMQTEVLVPDGGTTVVGGVLADQEGETQNRTPGLGGLPVVGNLFKRRATNRTTNELLFFITPRIYRPDYNGRPISGTVTDHTRSTSIPQPVPLGNPQTNTPPSGAQPQANEPAGNTVVLPAPAMPAAGARPPQPEKE